MDFISNFARFLKSHILNNGIVMMLGNYFIENQLFE